MSTYDLTQELDGILQSHDNKVIIKDTLDIPGGRTLDMTGFLPDVVYAGHPIIKDNSVPAIYKPFPVNTGSISTLGAITPGSGYTNDGTYTEVALTGGTGTGAKATVIVSGNAVSSVVITTPGTGYKSGDSLSAAAANIGTGGSGFAVAVSAVSEDATGYGTLPANHTYAGILKASILKTKPAAGIMVGGQVNNAAMQLDASSILAALKTALPLIDFRTDKQ